MHRTSTAALLLAGTAAALLAGGGTALADGTAPPDRPPVTITLTPEQSAQLCDERVPRLLERVTDLRARAGGGAGTVGSTAWLAARVEAAEAAGRTGRAALLRDRLERRATLPDRLDELEARVVGFRDAHCAP